jgi:hypothetical protein
MLPISIVSAEDVALTPKTGTIEPTTCIRTLTIMPSISAAAKRLQNPAYTTGLSGKME